VNPPEPGPPPGQETAPPAAVPPAPPLNTSSLWTFTDERNPTSLPPWFRRAVITVIILLIITGVVRWAFQSLTGFWFTLFTAFFLALAIEPGVNALDRRGVRRGLGTMIVLLGLLAFTIVFFAVFGNLLVSQLTQLLSSVPDALRSIIAWVNETFNTELDASNLLEAVGLQVSDLANYAADIGLGLVGYVFSAVGAIFNVFTVLLFTFYFAADGPRFRRTVASWMPQASQRNFLTIFDISTQKAGGYVVSRGLMAVVSSIFHGIVFLLIDLPYWLPMALWVGIVSQFIPTIGTYLAGALPIILALVEGDYVKAIIVLIAVVAYQQVENYYVQPRITQSTLQIHAAVAFGSVIVGATLFGATGALLAIPVVATAQAVWETYGRRYELVDELLEPHEVAAKAGVDAAAAGQ
jgi:predicted PurR-regulated permease PerM